MKCGKRIFRHRNTRQMVSSRPFCTKRPQHLLNQEKVRRKIRRKVRRKLSTKYSVSSRKTPTSQPLNWLLPVVWARIPSIKPSANSVKTTLSNAKEAIGAAIGRFLDSKEERNARLQKVLDEMPFSQFSLCISWMLSALFFHQKNRIFAIAHFLSLTGSVVHCQPDGAQLPAVIPPERQERKIDNR